MDYTYNTTETHCTETVIKRVFNSFLQSGQLATVPATAPATEGYSLNMKIQYERTTVRMSEDSLLGYFPVITMTLATHKDTLPVFSDVKLKLDQATTDFDIITYLSGYLGEFNEKQKEELASTFERLLITLYDIPVNFDAFRISTESTSYFIPQIEVAKRKSEYSNFTTTLEEELMNPIMLSSWMVNSTELLDWCNVWHIQESPKERLNWSDTVTTAIEKHIKTNDISDWWD